MPKSVTGKWQLVRACSIRAVAQINGSTAEWTERRLAKPLTSPAAMGRGGRTASALGAGRARATLWSCDLSYDYVRINAEYTT